MFTMILSALQENVLLSLFAYKQEKQNLCAPVLLQNSKKQKIHLHTLRKINVYMNTLDLP